MLDKPHPDTEYLNWLEANFHRISFRPFDGGWNSYDLDDYHKAESLRAAIDQARGAA